MNWWQQLLVSLAGGVVAAFVTTILSLRRFSRERWWERRLVLYTAIIEALHDRMRWWQELLDAQEDGAPSPPDYREKVRSAFLEGSGHLPKLEATAELLLKPASAKVLSDYLYKERQAPHLEDQAEFYNGALASARFTLSALRKAAREDLGLKGTTRF